MSLCEEQETNAELKPRGYDGIYILWLLDAIRLGHIVRAQYIQCAMKLEKWKKAGHKKVNSCSFIFQDVQGHSFPIFVIIYAPPLLIVTLQIILSIRSRCRIPCMLFGDLTHHHTCVCLRGHEASRQPYCCWTAGIIRKFFLTPSWHLPPYNPTHRIWSCQLDL